MGEGVRVPQAQVMYLPLLGMLWRIRGGSMQWRGYKGCSPSTEWNAMLS